ncbi:universal stress protein [Dictyobacter kobayashii]|uniref:Universal stress protein UspA n=1 Tax=Dictyobacter kobayashii TaxID=2014872 RepID=A0A402ANE0_9CHLR|nr:universal stress protein [Dictyobacter kobayashii]GCE20535.1 universal stress protein UspA [Dictyobacter kobayashii]
MSRVAYNYFWQDGHSNIPKARIPMFRRILVPLDGSPRAEQVLPLAAHIARTYNSTIVLTRIVDIFETIGASTIQAATLTNEIREIQEKEAQQYLQRVLSDKALEQLETSIEIHSGDVATTLLELIKRQPIDLVVMTSHGYTGYKQWMLGSVAQKMVHDSPTPVLIQRDNYPLPFGTAARDLKICVALDGSALAETILAPALYLAAACAEPRHREVHLLRIVKTLEADRVEAFLKIHKLNLQQFLYDEASNYLKEISERLNKDTATQLGVNVTWSVSLGRDIAQTIIREVEGETPVQHTPLPYNLLALATHGRSGIARWAVGSVADRIFHHSKLPLLVIHPPKAG